MWQATKDLILTTQHKRDVHKCYEDFKTFNNIVQELNRSDHGSPFVGIICCENGDNLTTLTPDAKLKLIKKGEERMLAMQLIMNADPDKYGSLIKSYDEDIWRKRFIYVTELEKVPCKASLLIRSLTSDALR